MPFYWNPTPQIPSSQAPNIIPNNAVTTEVNVVANTVNVGGTLLYNTSAKGYDVIYPSANGGNVVAQSSNTLVTLNASFANINTATVGAMNVSYANITKAIFTTLNAASMNLATLYNPTMVTGTVSANPTTALGIASKQYVDAHFANAVAGANANTGQISVFAGSLPNGWIRAIHQDVSRTTYANLYALYGTRYGIGDGNTTFGVPASYQSIEAFRGGTNVAQTLFFTHTTTLLGDGRLLKIGGFSTTATANTYFGNININSITWVSANSLPVGRSGHTTTLLSNTLVLVIGGYDGVGSQSNTFFGNISGNNIIWTEGTPLLSARLRPTTELLPDGRIVVMGGQNSGFVATNTVYFGTISGTTIAWVTSPQVLPARLVYHTTNLLPNGYILLTGGFNEVPVVQAQVYMGLLANGGNSIAWTSLFSLPGNGRLTHTCTLLTDGRVLLMGGSNGVASQPNCFFGMISNTQVQWKETTPLPLTLNHHTATLVPSTGQVVVVGGHDGTTPRGEVWIAHTLIAGVKT
jgi:hypothetical protein